MRRIVLIVFYIIIFAIFMLNPFTSISKDIIDYQYIYVDINQDGSINVKEYYSLSGEYNGSYRNLNYIGSNKPFLGDKKSFEGSDIYNGSNIRDIKVYDTLKDNSNILKNNQFVHVDYAKKGDSSVYTSELTSKGTNLQIFNPSDNNTDFLIEYTIDDVVIIHNDVAEIGWNFFGIDFEENIKNLVITFSLPSDSEELKAFAHGPLGGEVLIEDSKTVTLRYDYLPKKTPIDVRLVFDREIILEGTKLSNTIALDKILDVEEERVELANKKRLKARIVYYLINGVTCLWLLGLILIVIKVYRKYDKEEVASLNERYLREFPASYGPGTLDYLLNKEITSRGITASILELIRKEVLIVKPGSTQKDYRLILNVLEANNLSKANEYLKDWLIKDIGNGKEVSIGDIAKVSKSQTTASKFLKKYEEWKGLIKDGANADEFFKDNTLIKVKASIYVAITSLVVFLLNGIILRNIMITIFIIVGAIGSIIYFVTFKTRTKKGNEDYVRWQAFKRFLKDFGKFSEKDLPEVMLWERYLVFATVLGIAKKLEKVMKVKLENMSIEPNIMGNYTFLYFHHDMLGANLGASLSTSISRNISTAVTSSKATLGHGGGTSFGGGGFGGGGGGGRF